MTTLSRKDLVNPASRTRHGFTLVEILIVVIILGILAAIVIPQFSGAAQSARETTLKDLTRNLRMQMMAYKSQHRDTAPGIGAGASAATESDFVAQMTTYSNEDGVTVATADAQHTYGPYLAKMPVNPLNNFSTLKVVTGSSSMPTADNTTGWMYQADTMTLMPNSTGLDEAGVAYTSY